jgi:hypothetical protein
MQILRERDSLRKEVELLRNAREKTPIDKVVAQYCDLVKLHLEEHKRILQRDMDELARMEAEYDAMKILDSTMERLRGEEKAECHTKNEEK